MKDSLFVFIACFLLPAIPPAVATPFTDTHNYAINSTTLHIQIVERRPPAGDTYTVTYTNAAGVLTTTEPAMANSLGLLAIDVIPRPGTNVSVTNTTEGITNPGFVASNFSPPSNVVVSNFGVNPGSTLMLGGNTFTLGGGFTAVQTAITYDPTSPSYGIELGHISNALFTATGSAGSVQFEIENALTRTNLASAWQQVLLSGFPAGGLSIEQDFAFLGLLVVGGIATPFTGSFIGTATFFADGSTTAQGALNMSTFLGAASGFLSTSAFPQLVPEPGSLSLLLAGLLAAFSGAQASRVLASLRPRAHYPSEQIGFWTDRGVENIRLAART